MIRPPPEAFVRATERHRAQASSQETPSQETSSQETSSALRLLGWAAAALLTLGLHVGLYLALTRQAELPAMPAELPAAVMIDMSPEPTVARSATDNASNEPEAPKTEQAAPDEEPPPPPDPEPVVEAPPPQVKPQAVLPPAPPKEARKPSPKPPEKKPLEKKLVERKPETPARRKDKLSAASRNGGGPRSDQQTGERTAASAAGAALSQASRASWQNEIRARIVRSKRFPPSATGALGVAVVSVTFAGNGSVTSAQLVRSSGNAALDAEAVAVMYRAAPFPPPPGGQAISQMIPLNFNRR